LQASLEQSAGERKGKRTPRGGGGSRGEGGSRSRRRETA
jgi:hypothetical protein